MADASPGPTPPAPRPRRHPWSLQRRLLSAAAAVLLTFLGATALLLDHANRGSAEQALRDRLQGFLWAYLSGSDVSVGGKLIPPEYPPDPGFDRPNSDLFAGITGAGIHWVSTSALEHKLPFDKTLAPNQTEFAGPLPTELGDIYVLSMGVSWDVPNRGAVDLTLHVAQTDTALSREISVFRRSLWTLLGGLAAGLLIILLLTLRWGLRPVRRLASDLAEVEAGSADHLVGPYPTELAALTANLNDFIEGERARRTRYRNTLSDLAHSLKTPLAVLRNEVEDQADPEALKATVREQVERMDDIVAYQLSRAAASGSPTLAAPLPIEATAEEIVRGLEKVYADRGILCEFDLDPTARFFGAEGDLSELLGNLLENAFKWARSHVLLKVAPIVGAHTRRPGLRISVEDDGPGIPPEKVPDLLKRGVRGDERVAGHGIGLAIVSDIVENYRGMLSVERSPELGGAIFQISIPPL